MPRPPRLHVPGAHYHVILRGNHREALFGSNADRQALNEIVADVLARFGGRIHAFCWMTNHLHALLQIAEHPLGKTMQRIAMRFSRYRHRALNTTGHLFERRYKAKLVDVDAYFLALLRYIHLNPVKACIVSDPADYPWSSHRAYLGLECLPWLTTDFSLMMFSPDLSQARSAYLRFITNDTDIEDPDTDCHPEDSRILGTDRFIESLPITVYRPRSTVTLAQLANEICISNGIDPVLLCSPSRARSLTAARILLATRAVNERVATLTEVARFLHRDPSAITKLLSRHHTTRLPKR